MDGLNDCDMVRMTDYLTAKMLARPFFIHFLKSHFNCVIACTHVIIFTL